MATPAPPFAPLPPLAPGTPAAAALILAAGRGERMRPLTDTTPKPLLPVQGRPLIAWHLDALRAGGVSSAVINTAWLEARITAQLGPVWPPAEPQPPQETAPKLALHYSREQRDFGHALETAGGIVRALPWLDETFWLVAGDVFVPGFVFDPAARARFAASPMLAHLWLVPNPPHHPGGDFGLSPEGLALNLPTNHPGPRYTYSTIGLYKRALFAAPLCDLPPGNPDGTAAALGPLLRRAMDAGAVSASLYTGPWTDVGTPQRLAQLNAVAPDRHTGP